MSSGKIYNFQCQFYYFQTEEVSPIIYIYVYISSCQLPFPLKNRDSSIKRKEQRSNIQDSSFILGLVNENFTSKIVYHYVGQDLHVLHKAIHQLLIKGQYCILICGSIQIEFGWNKLESLRGLLQQLYNYGGNVLIEESSKEKNTKVN